MDSGWGADVRPAVAVVMNVRDSGAQAVEALASVRDLVGHWTVVNTGSVDDTPDRIADAMAGMPGDLHREPWVGYAHNRTRALERARGTADWLLWLDSDMTADAHEDLRTWLANDEDPSTDAWNVEVVNNGTRYRLPLLLRGDLEWELRGVVHEYVWAAEPRKTRPLLGLTVTHHGGHRRDGKLEEDLELLRLGRESGDPRSTFYFAETLRHLGRSHEAAVAYRARAEMDETWEEERWYAQYQAAALSGDVGALLVAHSARPWRHEPLSAAARIVCSRGAGDDVLFIEGILGG